MTNEYNIPDKVGVTYTIPICQKYCKQYWKCRYGEVEECQIINKDHRIRYNGATFGTLIINSEWNFCDDYCQYSYHCRHNLVQKCRITQTNHTITVLEDCFRNDGGIAPPIAPFSE